MTEREWVEDGGDVVVEQYAEEGLRAAVDYNRDLAEDQAVDMTTWTTRALEEAILQAAQKAGCLRDEDKHRCR